MFKKFFQLLPIAGCAAFVLFILNIVGITSFDLVTGFVAAAGVTVVFVGITAIAILSASK